MTPDIDLDNRRRNFWEGAEIPDTVIQRAIQISSRQYVSFGEKNEIVERLRIFKEKRILKEKGGKHRGIFDILHFRRKT